MHNARARANYGHSPRALLYKKEDPSCVYTYIRGKKRTARVKVEKTRSPRVFIRVDRRIDRDDDRERAKTLAYVSECIRRRNS